MHRLTQVSILLTSLLMVAACGGDDDPAGPTPADITGSWAYEATLTGTVGGEPITCSVDDAIVELTATDDSLTGSTNFGTLTCTTGGDTTVDPLGSYTIVNGSLDGTRIEFDFGADTWHHEGTVSVSDHRMSGTVAIAIDLPEESVLLTGSWSARDVT